MGTRAKARDTTLDKMKKDIEIPVVENIAVAVVLEKNEKLNKNEWIAYLINLKEEEIEGVLVSSKGYGKRAGEDVRTSELRHFLDTLEPKSYKKIEMITDELVGISNEFWVSFYLNGKMYDKKYIFLAEAISENNFMKVPIIQKKGIMIQ